MTREEHVELAERLLESAKDVSRDCGKGEHERKTATLIVAELLDFSRVHAAIATAMTE